MDNYSRIKWLREGIDSERVAVMALEIDNPICADELSDVMTLLDIIDAGFLRKDIIAHPRTSGQWDWWLGRASNLLVDAIEARENFSRNLPSVVSPVAEYLHTNFAP